MTAPTERDKLAKVLKALAAWATYTEMADRIIATGWAPRAAVIEKCARVADQMAGPTVPAVDCGRAIAAAIRALAGRQAEPPPVNPNYAGAFTGLAGTAWREEDAEPRPVTEPRGCPTPGSCSCVDRPVTDAEVEAAVAAFFKADVSGKEIEPAIRAALEAAAAVRGKA